ncbi:MAG: type II secretion system F family protein [Ruminiclostridium sp.]|nr:type II secretion system F family protein [Ruminiclostridium sp.]
MNGYVSFIIFFFLFFINLYLLIRAFSGKEDSIQSRLKRIKEEGQTEEETIYSKPFSERVIKPVIENVGKSLMKLAPTEWIHNMETKIIMAGKPKNRGVKDWITLQAIFIFLFPGGVLFMMTQLHVPLKSIVMVTLSITAIILLYPSMALNSKIRVRQKEILKSLPDVMDLLTVSVEAGLNFDAALSRVVEKMPGTLSREFETVLQEIKVGRSKKDALYDMADRLNVQDLRSFIAAVVQADQLGVSLGRVLRIQAEQIRLNRKQRIQEQAMKAPVKILIPMVIFIFPVIFIVLLGPVAINLIDMFSNW